MAARLLFQIAAELESKGFKDLADKLRDVDAAQKKGAESSGLWSKETTLLQAAYGGLVGLGIVEFYKSAVDESARAEQATAMLGQRVEQTGLLWEKVKGQVLAYTEALSAQSRFENDDLNAAMTRMIDKTNDVGKSQKLLQDAMGFSIARGVSLADAADLVAGASMHLTRNQTELARSMGIGSKEAQNNELVMATLHDRFGKLATSEDTTQKNLAQFNNSIKEFKKTVGDFYTPILKEIIDGTLRFGRTLAVVGEMVGAYAALSFTLWSNIFKVMYDVVTGEVSLLWSFIKMLGKVGEALLNLVLEPIKTASAAISKALVGDFKGAAQELAGYKGFEKAWANIKEGAVGIKDTFASVWDKVAKDVKVGISAVGPGIEEMKDLFNQLWTTLSAPATGAGVLPEALANLPTKFKELSNELLKIQDEFRAASTLNEDEILNYKLKALDHEKQVRAEAIRQRMEAEGYSAAQINSMILDSDKAVIGEKQKLYQAALQKQTAMFFESGKIIGVATAKMLKGDKDAWKDASKAIIDIIAQQTMASVMASSISAAAKHLEATAGMDMVGAAGIIGWGVAQTAAIAGLAEAAKAGIGSADTGGGSPTPSTGGGGGGGGGTPVAAAPAASASTQTIYVDIRGDLYGEPQFIDGLATKLSAAVENRDVRLVARQTTIR